VHNVSTHIPQETAMTDTAKRRPGRPGRPPKNPPAMPAADPEPRQRPAMYEAGVVMWSHRKEPDDVSALQHAENLLCDKGRAVFFSEYQNEPVEDATTASPLKPADICARLNRQPRWTIPDQCEHMTAKIDVGGERLHLAVLAAQPDGTPYLVHAQTWPARGSQTLADAYPGLSPEGRLYAALDALATAVVLPERRRRDGTPMRVARLHVDASWMPGTIRRWCRQGAAAAIAHPEEGAKIGATASPLASWKPRPGERRGDGWLIQPARNGSRTVIVDTSQWKTYTADRLQTPLGTPGALTLWGDDATTHRELAEHCCAEYPVTVTVSGSSPRQVWRMRPGKSDNHYWDCIVGALVALSIIGVQYRAGGNAPAKPQKQQRRRAHVCIT
jgi:phage terminase large subunit GpA-like protein